MEPVRRELCKRGKNAVNKCVWSRRGVVSWWLRMAGASLLLISSRYHYSYYYISTTTENQPSWRCLKNMNIKRQERN